MKLLKIALVVAVLSLAGCASAPLNKRAENQTLAVPSPQMSRVVFLRPSMFGYAISAVLFDVTNDSDPKLLGISSAGSKMVYDVPPGTHRFMVYSEAADFMEAKLAPGKTYYAVVAPRMGAWKARFSLWPVKATSSNEFNLRNPDLQVWVKNGTLVEKIPKADEWYQKNGPAVRKTKDEYEVVWKQKTPEGLAERTLEEHDGVLER